MPAIPPDGEMDYGAMIWRTAVTLGRLEAHVMGNNRRIDEMRREMFMLFKEGKRSGGLPLWVHIAAMGLISAMSALGLVRPEVAMSIMRMLGKAFTG